MISFILHRLESRTRPILTPYDGRRRWDSNLRTPACKSPALPLCYGRRKFTIEYSKWRRYEANERQKRLERQLCELERNLTTENRVSKYNEVKRELKQIDDEKINGHIIRSKVRWHEEGERSTKYFLSLEKARAVKKHLQKLKLKDGRITTDPKEILSAQVDFYRKLYSSKLQDNPTTYNLFDHTITLNDVDRDDCEGAITIKECEEALHTFKNDKSPGNDGITSEFYKHFWGELSHFIVDCFNFSYEKGELATSQKQAIISLVDKGKDRLFWKIGGLSRYLMWIIKLHQKYWLRDCMTKFLNLLV